MAPGSAACRRWRTWSSYWCAGICIPRRWSRIATRSTRPGRRTRHSTRVEPVRWQSSGSNGQGTSVFVTSCQSAASGCRANVTCARRHGCPTKSETQPRLQRARAQKVTELSPLPGRLVGLLPHHVHWVEALGYEVRLRSCPIEIPLANSFGASSDRSEGSEGRAARLGLGDVIEPVGQALDIDGRSSEIG